MAIALPARLRIDAELRRSDEFDPSFAYNEQSRECTQSVSMCDGQLGSVTWSHEMAAVAIILHGEQFQDLRAFQSTLNGEKCPISSLFR